MVLREFSPNPSRILGGGFSSITLEIGSPTDSTNWRCLEMRGPLPDTIRYPPHPKFNSEDITPEK